MIHRTIKADVICYSAVCFVSSTFEMRRNTAGQQRKIIKKKATLFLVLSTSYQI